jgi:WXG100 family type VII secretion target
MAHSFFQLNYDQLASIAKKFREEGEDIAQLHSVTRQRVRDLHKEWIGDAADKFFDEMETELLPAVQRLAQALFQTQDVTGEIMKIIQEADEETAGYFRDQLSGDDFGASLFGSALDGAQAGPDSGAGRFGEALGSVQGGDASAPEDFGAGKFGEAVGGVPGSGGSSAPEDFGAGTFEEALGGSSSDAANNAGSSGDSSSSEGGGGGDSSDKKQKDKETPEPETEPTSGGGGGGSSSSSSQGLQGDLKNQGIGLSNQAPQTASAGGDPSPRAADHIYSGAGSSPKPDESPVPRGDESKPGVDTGGSGQPASTGGTGAAAGAAGAAGAAAAGGAAKAVRGKAKKNGQ